MTLLELRMEMEFCTPLIERTLRTLLFNGHAVNDSGLTYDPDKNLFWDIDFSGNLFSYDPTNAFARTTHLTGLGSHDGLAYLTQA